MLFLFISLFGESPGSLEEHNEHIKIETDPVLMQWILCDREYLYIKKNPQECIKAAEMILSLVGKKTTERQQGAFLINGVYKESYQRTVNEQKKISTEEIIKIVLEKKAASLFNSAGVIYGYIGDHKNEVKMFEKSLQFDENNDLALGNLGYAYYDGSGVVENPIKAYQYLHKSAALGNVQVQENLNIICSTKPWACK